MIKLIAPLLAVTPLTYHTIRVGNISPIIAALLGWTRSNVSRSHTCRRATALGAVLNTRACRSEWSPVHRRGGRLSRAPSSPSHRRGDVSDRGTRSVLRIITVIVPSLNIVRPGKKIWRCSVHRAADARRLASAVAKFRRVLIGLRGIQIVALR